MTNYIQQGHVITVPAPVGGVPSGQLVVIGAPTASMHACS